jgi:hypothetical protein
VTRKIFTFLSVSRQLLQRGAAAVLGFPQVEQVAWEPPQRTGFSVYLWLKKLLLNRRGAENAEIRDETFPKSNISTIVPLCVISNYPTAKGSLELVLDLRCAVVNIAI